MSWLEALILGLIQGLTEFLPVSSSGHLTIAQYLFGLDSAKDNLQFDVVVHAATVCSTIFILRKEIFNLLKGCFANLQFNDEKKYVVNILISMMPILIIGLFFKDFVEHIFGQGLLLVGICLIITALLLTFANFAKERKKDKISVLDAFIIGIAQMIAVLPGLSRSGATIGIGLLLGNKRENVAKFSFLMVLIPILGEAFLNLIKIIKTPGNLDFSNTFPLMVGFFSAFLVGCLACKFMLNIVKKGKIIWFAVYCALLGAVAIYTVIS